MLSNIREQQLTTFDVIIESDECRDQLRSILVSRLGGSFDVHAFVPDTLMVSFNFHKNLTDEQKYYLDKFDKYYFPTPLIKNTEYMQLVVDPVVQDIKTNYDTVNQFMREKPADVKQAIVQISQFGENHLALNNLLEFYLVVSKMHFLDELVKQQFHTILAPDFNVRQLIQEGERPNFADFYDLVADHIRTIYHDKIKAANILPYLSDAEATEHMHNANMLVTAKQILNGLFWIIYANEFKFIHNIQTTYLVEEEKLEEYQDKLSVWFNYEEEVMTETGEVHCSSRNLLNDAFEHMDKVEHVFSKHLYGIMAALDDRLDDKTTESILENELEKYVNALTTDEEERRVYRNDLCIWIPFVMVEKMFK
jgi:hypothetical protein